MSQLRPVQFAHACGAGYSLKRKCERKREGEQEAQDGHDPDLLTVPRFSP